MDKLESQVPDEILYRLSEERGINPEMAISIGNDLGWKEISVRVGFAADMAARNALITKETSKNKNKEKQVKKFLVAPTSLDYYEDTKSTKFNAEIITVMQLSKIDANSFIFSNEVEEIPKYIIILDRTLFYPEGGGQFW